MTEAIENKEDLTTVEATMGSYAEIQDLALSAETNAILAVVDAAKAWWVSFRPELYSEAEHIDNPTVNQTNPKEVETLCRAVAHWVTLGG